MAIHSLKTYTFRGNIFHNTIIFTSVWLQEDLPVQKLFPALVNVYQSCSFLGHSSFLIGVTIKSSPFLIFIFDSFLNEYKYIRFEVNKIHLVQPRLLRCYHATFMRIIAWYHSDWYAWIYFAIQVERLLAWLGFELQPSASSLNNWGSQQYDDTMRSHQIWTRRMNKLIALVKLWTKNSSNYTNIIWPTNPPKHVSPSSIPTNPLFNR